MVNERKSGGETSEQTGEQTSIERIAGIVALFALWGMLFFTHRILISAGPDLLHADYAIQILLAEAFRKGDWIPFHFDLPYAGTTGIWFRALWTSGWEALFPSADSWWKANWVFNAWVTPSIVMLSAWWMVRRITGSWAAASFAGALVAAGIPVLESSYPNEVYIAYIAFGCWLLGVRSRWSNPFIQLSHAKLFWISVASGLAIYTSRITQLYIIAFFVPWSLLPAWIRSFLSKPDLLNRILIRLAAALMVLFVYLEVFGSNLGTFRGSPVKLHAVPNLKIALGLVGIVAIRAQQTRIFTRERVIRGALLLSGFVVGFMPELQHWIRVGGGLPASRIGHHSIAEVAQIAGMLPGKFQEVFNGTAESIARNAILILLVSAHFALFRAVRTEPRRLESLAVMGLLALLAYLRFRTYDFATSRYLLPFLPAVFAAFGLLWHRASMGSKGRRMAVHLTLILLLGIHAGVQYGERMAMASRIREARKPESASAVIERFRSESVKVVLVTDYWHSNNYTALARSNPVFFMTGFSELKPALAKQLAATETRVGVALAPSIPAERPRQLSSEGRTFDLEYLGKFGERDLFIGKIGG